MNWAAGENQGRNTIQYSGIVSVPKPVSTEMLFSDESAAYARLQLQEAERSTVIASEISSGSHVGVQRPLTWA